MKKRILIALSVIAIVMTMFGVTACGGKSEAFLTPATSASVKIDEENKTMTVEAGVTSSIPQAAVTDKDGNILSDYVVTRLVTKPDGTKSPATVTLSHGDELTVKYTAVKGEEKLEKTYSLKCYDTILPTLTFLNLSRTYAEGTTITIGFTDVSADLDRENSTVTLRNVTANTTENISLDAGCEFIATAGEYTLTAALKDLSGNENTIEKSFKVVAPFTDENVDDHCIWDFNEEGYLANVAFAADGDTADAAIVDDTDGENPIKALKISAKAGKTYNITFTKGATLRIYEQEAISFRVKSDKIVDIFEVYNADDGTMYDLSWKTGGYDGYITAYAPISTLFNEGYELSALKVKLSTEVDTDIYIDYIGYTDPAPIFTDDDLPENMLAAFDEAGYLERISAASGKDHTTFNASWSYEAAADCPAGSTDGAIKFVSSTDPATTSDKQARDGFTYRFNKRLKASDFKNLAFRVYCEGEFSTLSLSFSDRKKGDTVYRWVGGALGVKNEWITVRVPSDKLAETLKGCENIVSVCVRFHRPATSPTGAVLYLDGISNIEAGYADYNYDFGSLNDPDFYAAEAIDGGTVIGMVADGAAKDGYALKAVTAFGTKSGVKINFNDLDVSEYSEVRVRLRSANPSNPSQAAVGIYLNGSASTSKYGAFGTYTTIDIKQYLGSDKLSSIEFARRTVKGIEIYIDSITFVRPTDYSQVNYDFSSEDDYDLVTANEYNGGEVEGIVADAAATDGYALKATTVPGGANGVSIRFDHIDLSLYERVIVRLRTEGGAISIGANGKGYIGGFGEYATYDKGSVNIMNYAAKLTELGITHLDSIEIYRNVANIAIYIDSITFVEPTDYSRVNYDFSSADDYDLRAVSGYNGASVAGIVADSAAKDGYALKGSTANTDNSGIKILFNNIKVDDYAAIYLRLRATNSVSITVNGVGSKFDAYNTYKDYDISAVAKSNSIEYLTSIEIFRTKLPLDIYVDCVIFEEKPDFAKINYDFSSVDDYDMKIVSSYNGGTVSGIVADETATGNFALKATTVSGGANGVRIAFDDLTVADYIGIYVTLRTETANTGDQAKQVSLYINDEFGTNVYYNYINGYKRVNILSLMQVKGITATTLSAFTVARNVSNIDVYIDKIEFVKKTDASKYDYKFDSANDSDLEIVSSFEGRADYALVEDSTATGGYAISGQVKDNKGFQISFNNLNVSDYAKITLRYRSTDGVQFYANGGTAIEYAGKSTAYAELDLLYALKKSSITTLSSIETGRAGATPTVWIDSITFVKWSEFEANADFDYDFSSADDIDMTVVSSYKSGPVLGIVEDEKITDKTDNFALKAKTVLNGGVKIAFHDLKIDDYSSIKVRIRTYRSTNPQVTISMNGGKSLKWSGYADYADVDIIELFNTKKATDATTYNDTALWSIEIWRDSVADIEIYVDSITFVKKTA